MHTPLRALALALAIVGLSLGCASDPNAAKVHAEAAHDKDVRDNDAARVETGAEHAGEAAALDSAQDKDNANLDRKVADEQSAFEARKRAAEADMVAARRTHRAESGARWTVLDTRTVALEGKRAAKKLNEPALGAVRTRLTTARTSMQALDLSPDTTWFAASTKVDTELTAIEQEVKQIEARL